MIGKCDAYHIRKRNKYLDPSTIVHLTGKWPENNGVTEEEYGVCYGTKECDECSCGGDRMSCDFYPEVREKAGQQKYQTRDWIQVTFNNDGTYDESCVNAPIIDRRDKERYIQRYEAEILDKLNPDDVVKDLLMLTENRKGLDYGPEILLVCYEKPSDFCHRHLVAQWLSEHGYEVKEALPTT